MSDGNQTHHVERGYITVGRNVNKDGLVTGYCSESINVRLLNLQQVLQTTIIDTANLGEEHPTVVAARYRGIHIRALGLNIKVEFLTP